MILRVAQYGEDVLRIKGEKIQKFDDRLEKFSRCMWETMEAYEGIGLAAPQVSESISLCLVDMRVAQRREIYDYRYDGKRPPIELLMPLVLINPVVKFPGKAETIREEGCLSFPEIYGEVARPETIRVKFQDLKGARHTLECDGLLSRVIQHEVDHLNGILFIDKMDRKVLKPLELPLRRLKKFTIKSLTDKSKEPQKPDQ